MLALILMYPMTTTQKHQLLDEQLRIVFADEVRQAMPVEHWWADGTPSAALREATGGPAWRAWRALVDRCAPVPDPTLRSWFRLD